MIARIIVFVVEQIKKGYRKIYFRSKVRGRSKNVKILGDLFVFNPNVEIGENVTLYPGVTFMGEGKIIIGDNSKIGQNVIIYASQNGGVIIGSNTIIAAQTYIIDSNHKTEKRALISLQEMESKQVNIGNDVWIAANATIIKGANIQDGAVIGAKTLVNKDIAPYTINVGIPSRKIGDRG